MEIEHTHREMQALDAKVLHLTAVGSILKEIVFN